MRSLSPLNNKNAGIFLAVIFLFFLCLITYGDILTHRFMIDERIFVKSTAVVFNNEQVYADPSSTVYAVYKNFWDFFVKPRGHHYIPFNFLLNTSLFRLFHTPFPLYLINLLLFYINCVLLFIFVYLISKDLKLALFTSSLFCVHPMTGDMLQHITFNIIFIQTIFMESGLITLYLYYQQNRRAYYIISLLMVFLGIFSQEITLLFPLYAASLLFFLTDLKFKKIIKLTIPFVCLSLLLVALWLVIVNPSVHLERIKILHPSNFWSSSANFSHLFFWYLSNLIVPRDIVFMSNMPLLNDGIWLWSLSFFVFWAACGLLIFFYFKKSLESFALILFLTGFIYAIPASQTRPDMGAVFEPNWVYFSSMGFYLFIVLIFLRSGKYMNKLLLIVLSSVILVYYFAFTVELNMTSRTEISYAQHWLRKSPGNRIAMDIVASYYVNHKDARMPSDFIPDMLDLVDSYTKEDVSQVPDLIERIRSCRLSPVQRNELDYKLAAYHCKNDHHDKCEEAIHGIIGPKKDPYAYLQLSYMFSKVGADKTAVALLKECISLYPKYKEPYLLIGVILANDGHYEESIGFWERGSAVDPSDPRFISNIARARDFLIGNPGSN